MKFKEFIKREYKFIILLVVIVLLCYVKIPYYIMAPGGTINITDRVVMENYVNDKGSLNMLYVSEYDATPMLYLLAKVRGFDTFANENRQVANESVKDIDERNKIMRDNSLDIATLVAYNKAGKDIEIKKKNNIVIGTTSDNGFKVGDVIKTVNGSLCEDVQDIRNIIGASEIGDKISFVIDRNGKEKTIESEVYIENNSKVVGVIIMTEYDYELNPKIDIKFKNSESGPSGGLMLTLTIYNAISEDDLIKGRNIAGTGTISIDGSVGEIDGVKYKIMGAAKNGIDIVFVPSSNYEEAIATKDKYNYNMEIVKVDTVDEAIEYLKK